MRRPLLLAAGLALALFALDTRTLCPAFHADDSPETIAACATLSIQHPPGYPLHTLLGRLASLAWPGSPAWGLNQLAAVLGALSAGLLLLLALCILAELGAPRAGREGLAAALAALAGLGWTWWSLSGTAKGGIYTLNLALSLCLFLLALAARERMALGQSPRRALAGLGLCLGLGLAGHWPSQLALLPSLALLLGPGLWRQRGSALRWMAPALAGLLAGLSLYLYLPLRASQHPLLSWGPMRSLADAWAVVSRARYAAAEGSQGFSDILLLAGQAWRDLLAEFHPLGLALLGLGWGLLLWRRLWLGLSLLAWPLGLLAAVVLRLHLSPDILWVMDPYLLPAHAGLCLGFLGLALAPGLLKAPAFARPAWLPGLAVAGLALGLGLKHLPLCDQRQDFLAWDYANNLLLSCPRSARLLCASDINIASPLVPRFLLGRRQDLSLLVTSYLSEPWYREGLSRNQPSLALPALGLNSQETVAALAQLEPGRPLYLTGGHEPGQAEQEHLLPRGLALGWSPSRAPFSSQSLAQGDPWPAYSLRSAFGPSRRQDAAGSAMVLENYRQCFRRLAEAQQQALRWGQAEQAWLALARLSPGDAGPLIQAGVMAQTRGSLSQALGYWQRAVEAEPGSARAWSYLGLGRFNSGQFAEALRAGQRALALDPAEPNALSLVAQSQARLSGAGAPAAALAAGPAARALLQAQAAVQAGRLPEALKAYQQARALGDDSVELHWGMAICYHRMRQLPQARAELERAVALRPGDGSLCKALAVTLYDLGEGPAALAATQRALALLPGDAELLRLKGALQR
jgi:tetratricopeptide (TPR) repeat protein